MSRRGVIQTDSITTKRRLVFDAAQKSTNDVSFNDNDVGGPVVQDSLYNLLLSFRLHAFVITGDIETCSYKLEPQIANTANTGSRATFGRVRSQHRHIRHVVRTLFSNQDLEAASHRRDNSRKNDQQAAANHRNAQAQTNWIHDPNVDIQ